jgi:metacaspase-1
VYKKENMKNKALLVGINKYPDPRNELRGCVNDILEMENFIAETNKVYLKQNIKKLTNKEATKKGILTQLKWLIEGAEAGDQLLFHYSGHGAQSPTKFTSLEKDGLDEIICPYDFDGTNNTSLRDKEFAELFTAIPKGVHFVWISDSCHAEDLSRDPFMLDVEDFNANNTHYRFFTGLQHYEQGVNEGEEKADIAIGSIASTIKPLNGALLSACESHELSADTYINKRFIGAFTHYLIENLNNYSDTKNMRSIIELVNKDLEKNGYEQNPQSEGLLENKFFFL